MRSILLFLLALTIATRPVARGQKFDIAYTGNQGETPSGRLVQASDGSFYGTTYEGGAIGYGTVFKMSLAGVHTVLFSFNESTGKNPGAGLVLGSDGNFYGTTVYGGKSGYGTIFKVTPAGVLTTLVVFDEHNGSWPRAELVEGSDGCFYGTTTGGGAGNHGTVFKVTPAGELTTLAAFDGLNGSSPAFSLTKGSDGDFYGVTTSGGTSYLGTVFKVTPAGVLTSLVSFTGANGSYPSGALIEEDDGSFYGVTRMGGPTNHGTVFKVTPTGVLTMLTSFDGRNIQYPPVSGAYPYGTLAKGGDGDFYGATRDGGRSFRGTVFKITPAGVLTTLASFGVSDGFNPVAGLLLASDGSFYGTTTGGGPQERGSVFKVTPQGGITTLSFFTTPKGNYPSTLLAKGGDGNSYGLTTRGGRFKEGSIFSVTPDGEMTVVASFHSNSDGLYPSGRLVTGSDGSLYGTASYGGTSGNGTVFKMTPGGSLTALVSFDGSNGRYPLPGLTVGRDGNFYGATIAGGANNWGTLFKVTPAGEFTILFSFSPATGTSRAGIVEGRDGNFYGTTAFGGTYGQGTVFKVTPLGEFTTLASFDGSNGWGSYDRLLLASDGNFYGTTSTPRSSFSGKIFKVTPQGELSLLASFPAASGTADGGLVEGEDGNFYGATSWIMRSGVSEEGAIFKVTPDGILTTLYSFDGVTARSVTGAPAFGSDGKLYGAGAQMVIWSLPVPPSARTAPPNAITSRSASLSGIVNANSEVTTVNFEYGLTSSYGKSIAAMPGTVTGRNSAVVSASLSGLTPNTTYFFRITVSNSNGSTSSTEASFTTAPMATSDVFTRSSVVTTLPVLENDNDGDEAALTITAVTQGSLGTVTTDGRTLTYTPGPLFRGHDSFYYTVSDGFGSSTARVELWGPFTQALLSRDSKVPGAGQEGSEIAEGAIFKSFGELSLNSLGKLAFTASYGVPGSAAELAVFGFEPKEEKNTLVARCRQVASGTDGALFATFKDPLLNEAGEIAFLATLSGGDTTKKNREGIWISPALQSPSTEIQLIARTGTQPPGAPAGASWKSFTSVAFASGNAVENTISDADAGRWSLAFTGFMSTGAGGVTASNDMGLWIAKPSGIVLALREGQTLQIGEAEKKLRTFAALMPLSNALGQGNGATSVGGVAVQAFFTDGSQAVLRVSGPGENENVTIEALGLAGDAVAGIDETAAKFGIPVQSSAGTTTAWLGSLSGKSNPAAIFERNLSEPELLKLLTRKGDAAPGIEGASFSAFRSVAVNDTGDALFLGKVSGKGISGSSDEGLWWKQGSGDSASLQLLAREGVQAPGVPEGARWSSFTSLALSEGPYGPLFTAKLVAGGKGKGPGKITSANDQGLWAVDSKGELHLIVQEGQKVNVEGSSTPKTLKSFTVLSAVPGAPAQRRSFAEDGQIVYRALFTDGSQAIVKVQLP